MAKQKQAPLPIFLCKYHIPTSHTQSLHQIFHQVKATQDLLQARMPDYHVIIVPIIKQGISSIETIFESFYPTNCDERDFAQFKDEILASLVNLIPEEKQEEKLNT